MIFGKQSTVGVLLAFFAITTLPASAAAGFPHFGKKGQNQVLPTHKLTASQTALIDKAVAREKVVIATLKERAPLVETYIQTMKPDDVVGQAPESDQHFLGRVEFKNVIGDTSYDVNKPSKGVGGFFKNSASFITGISNSLHLNFNSTGFVQMLLIDSND